MYYINIICHHVISLLENSDLATEICEDIYSVANCDGFCEGFNNYTISDGFVDG